MVIINFVHATSGSGLWHCADGCTFRLLYTAALYLTKSKLGVIEGQIVRGRERERERKKEMSV